MRFRKQTGARGCDTKLDIKLDIKLELVLGASPSQHGKKQLC